MMTTSLEDMIFSTTLMSKVSDVINPGWSITLEIATQFLIVGVGV